MFLVLRVPFPLVVDADAAGEGGEAVDDQELAMGAVVDFLERIPAGLVEGGEAAAGGLQSLDVLLADAAAANRVDDQVHAHAAPRRLFKSAGEELGHFTGRIDVGFEADPSLCFLNGAKHRWKDLVAVS